MSESMEFRHRLEEYHLLWQENSNRLNRLELLRSLAEAEQPLTQQQKQECFIRHCILAPANRPDCQPDTEPETGAEQSPAWKTFCVYQARITPQLAANRRKMSQIEEEVSALPEPLEREVLRLRYLDSCCCRLTPWKQVALRLYGSDDTAAVQYVRRLHDLALLDLTAA